LGTTCGHPLLVVYRAQSIVLHNLTLSAQKSTFPTALGVKVTGVDDSTFSLTGDAYSAICMPHADTHTSRILQEDDTSLAYEFVSNGLLRTTTTTTHSRPTLLVLTGAQVPGELLSSRTSALRN
jgi:hypothetical protein